MRVMWGWVHDLYRRLVLLRRCHHRGHQWFPGLSAREFIPVENICLRCDTRKVELPWGHCIRKHPIAEHYDTSGHQVGHPTCPGPA